MGPFWNAWFEAQRLAFDVQSVIALRMLRLAAGGPGAAAEAQRMVTEKIAALASAQVAAGVALATGASLATAGARAATPIRRRVRANRRRLSRPSR